MATDAKLHRVLQVKRKWNNLFSMNCYLTPKDWKILSHWLLPRDFENPWRLRNRIVTWFGVNVPPLPPRGDIMVLCARDRGIIARILQSKP